MQIDVRAQIEDAVAHLRSIPRVDIPTIVALALNRTIEEGQTAVRAHIKREFTIRSPRAERFLFNMVKIEKNDRATPEQLRAVVQVTGPFNDFSGKKAALLTRHEEGGTHVGMFFVPAPGLRTASREVPRSMYPAALRLAARHTPDGILAGANRGKRRTYLVPGVGIFQRQGKGKNSETDSLWLFVKRVTLRPRLKFRETVAQVARERLPLNLRGFYDARMRKLAARVSEGRAA